MDASGSATPHEIEESTVRIMHRAATIAHQMKQRRTTISAAEAVLATLEAEAGRRGVSLTAVLREAVEDKARAFRTARRPRVGVARSTDGHTAAEVTAEPIAEEPR